MLVSLAWQMTGLHFCWDHDKRGQEFSARSEPITFMADFWGHSVKLVCIAK